jgi:hypothetical protein
MEPGLTKLKIKHPMTHIISKIITLVLSMIMVIVGLHLEPVEISQVFSYDFTFDINEKADMDFIREKFRTNLNEIKQTDINDDHLKTLYHEIFLSIGIDNTEVRHLKLQLNITQKLGILAIYNIEATINRIAVAIKMKTITLEQIIPQVYDTKIQCHKTGSRRFVIAGPRKEECYVHDVIRNLNSMEIGQVTAALMAKKLDAIKLVEFLFK